MMKVNEIFYSIQGEGENTGMPAVFIRFSGCNRDCWFCDTDHTTYKEMKISEILDAIKRFNCENIIITGGEPTIQEKFGDLTRQLFTMGYIVFVETNGTNKVDMTYVHWVTVSPKTEPKDIKLEFCDELKVVYYEQEDIDKWFEVPAARYYLQPCDDKFENKHRYIIKAIEKVKQDPRWMLSMQLQKILNIK